jgi:hypothetical protein
MTTETPTGGGGARRPDAYGEYSDSRRGDGWLVFAAVMLMIIGTINFIGGIAAIDDANFYVADAQFVFSDLNTWGWVILFTGTAQVLTAFGILARNQLSRWLGVGFASVNAMAQLLMIAAFPLWSLAIFAVDILIIYGLIAYGERSKSVA